MNLVTGFHKVLLYTHEVNKSLRADKGQINLTTKIALLKLSCHTYCIYIYLIA